MAKKSKKTKKTASAKKVVKKAVKKAAKKVAKKKVVKKAKKAAKKPLAKKTATKFLSTATLEKMFYPLYDRVLVLRDAELEKTAGGLFIPNTVQGKQTKGKVLAIGKGVVSKKGTLRPMDVKIGDTILFSQYTGTEVILEGQPLLLVKEDEILGVEEK